MEKINWEKLNANGEIFSPRTGHCATVIQNKIFLFGGSDENTRMNDLYVLNLDFYHWTKIEQKGDIPTARSGSKMISLNNFVYLFGGYVRKDGDYLNDLFMLDPLSYTWKKLQTKNPPRPRSDYSLITFENYLIIFGGNDGVKILKDLVQLNLNNGEGLSIYSQDGPSERLGHTAIKFDNYMYLFGGWNGSKTLNDLWEYDLKLTKWKLLSQTSPLPSRYRHSAVCYRNSMFIFGGVDHFKLKFDDLYEYCFLSNTWNKIKVYGESPSARSFHICLEIEGKMLLLGGLDDQRKNDVYAINLDLIKIFNEKSSNQNTPQLKKTKSSSNLLTKEQSFVEFQNLCKNLTNKKNAQNNLTQNFMETQPILLGFKQNYEYLPKNRWFYIQANNANIFSARTGHAICLLNDEIYLFGGIDHKEEKKNDLLQYSIIENKWYELHPKGIIPCPRSGMKIAAILNEEKPNSLFFFGGYITKDVVLCNDSFIYDIEQKMFQEIKIKNNEEIPSRRTDHSMVSFEENIYIFGGLGENKVILGDFKKFNVKTLQWKTIKGEGVFIKPRFGHIVCVYSSSMFLFGGWDGKKCLNDLYQYSFLTNIWYDIKSTLGEQPSPRYRHEGLIYKSSFYVFGGVNENQMRFNDLYQFFFERKEWKKIHVTGCIPTPRTFHRIANYSNLLISVGGFDGERKNEIFYMALDERDNFEEEKFSLSRMASLRDTDNNSPSQISDETVVHILTKQVKELSEKLQSEEERHLCKICFSKEIDALILDCCHFVLCNDCARNLTQCPICREKIIRIVRTHMV